MSTILEAVYFHGVIQAQPKVSLNFVYRCIRLNGEETCTLQGCRLCSQWSPILWMAANCQWPLKKNNNNLIIICTAQYRNVKQLQYAFFWRWIWFSANEIWCLDKGAYWEVDKGRHLRVLGVWSGAATPGVANLIHKKKKLHWGF